MRAAAFYAASAWLLVQIATQVFPFFHIAEWVVRAIVVAATLGFPFAMLFSWFYEWTPQGIQRESQIPPNESITRHTGKKLDRWIIAILLLAVVLLLTDKLVLRPNEKPVAGATAATPIPGKSWLGERSVNGSTAIAPRPFTTIAGPTFASQLPNTAPIPSPANDFFQRAEAPQRATEPARFFAEPSRSY